MIRAFALPALIAACTTSTCAAESKWLLWQQDRRLFDLILPAERECRMAATTFTNLLETLYGVHLPAAPTGRIAVIIGTAENNPRLGRLPLTTKDLGEEGFQILTHEEGGIRSIAIYAKTPRGLRHACQELAFYRIAATAQEGGVEPPLNVVMRPEVAYRGIYMLPCWSAYDSLESWEQVLRFNSELTINRNWFWLDGFPVAGHTGEYGKSDLAKATNVQRLLNLANDDGMKIYIGGGWFNWHHEKAVGKDYRKGIEYYLDYLRAFSNFHGFYIEPTGEGSEVRNWRPECDALRELIRTVLKERPEFEFSVAIGKFNNPEYLRLMSQVDTNRVFWWWCWGDPFRDKALELYPSVLRWHISQSMAEYHGSKLPPQPAERVLTGVTTSYDPGQGFGNSWNGWGKLGVEHPRNFHPHTIPYFGQQYLFRERCWNLNLSHAEFLKRLQHRLFDADAPEGAAAHYWKLSELAYDSVSKKAPSPEQLKPVSEMVADLRKGKMTPKMKDTLARMEEAVRELSKR